MTAIPGRWIFLASAATVRARHTISGPTNASPAGPCPSLRSPNTASWSFADGRGVIHAGTGGATLSDIPGGPITLTWGALDGYDLPAPNSRTQNLANSATITFVGNYLPYSGTLGIKVTPETAPWKLSGPMALSGTGTTTILHALIGSYSLTWQPLAGWTTPTPNKINFTLARNQVTTFTGIYIRQTGSLRVTIAPPQALTAGGQWRRVGTTPWLNSGFTETNIPTGNYSIEFKTVSGWVAPATKSVNIAQSQTSQVSGVYSPPPGALRVTLTPSGAVSAGAKWRRVGTIAWHDSATTETAVPIGSYAVEFKDTTGWRKPANKNATISTGKTTQLSAAYTGFLEIALLSPSTIGITPSQTATLQVATSGSLPITWQWKKNGVNVSGAIGASWNIDSCQWADQGLYACVAHNAYGTAESGKIRLIVNNGGPVLQYLLGLSIDPAGLDLNDDGKINVGDLLRGIHDTPPAAPDAPQPVIGATGVALKPRLNWTDCYRAQSYSVYLWKMATARPDAPNVTGLTASQWDVPNALEAATDYWWQVVAVGAASSTEGPIWVFKTK